MPDSMASDQSERTSLSSSGVSASSSGLGGSSAGSGLAAEALRRKGNQPLRAGSGRTGRAGRTISSHVGASVSSRANHGRAVNMSEFAVIESQMSVRRRRYIRCPSGVAACASEEAMIEPAEAPTKIVGVNCSSCSYR